jgi:hypothetical protein
MTPSAAALARAKEALKYWIPGNGDAKVIILGHVALALDAFARERCDSREWQTAFRDREAATWEAAAKIAEAPVRGGTGVNTRELWMNEMGRELARMFRSRARADEARGGAPGTTPLTPGADV